jgi:hypothetical protein
MIGIPRSVRTDIPVAGLLLAAAVCAGCSQQFRVRTEYLAEGFGRSALRGRNVALVLPEAGRFEREVRGVGRGLRGAGAGVIVIGPQANDEVDPDAANGAAAADAARDGAAYVMLVRPTAGEVFRSYGRHAVPEQTGERLATRTSGRRVGLRLTLLRVSDGRAVWVARGTGEMWQTRTAGPASAETVDGDLAGHADLYPLPPPPELVSDRLTRRLLAMVPEPVRPEPN